MLKHRLTAEFESNQKQPIMEAIIGGIQMTDEILEKMKKGVYYPGNHLGKKQEIKIMVEKGYLHRMDGSSICGLDSEPNYRLTDKGLHRKKRKLG